MEKKDNHQKMALKILGAFLAIPILFVVFLSILYDDEAESTKIPRTQKQHDYFVFDVNEPLDPNKKYHNPLFDKSDYIEVLSKLHGLNEMNCDNNIIIQLRKQGSEMKIYPVENNKPINSKVVVVLLEMSTPMDEFLMLSGYSTANELITIMIQKASENNYVTIIKIEDLSYIFHSKLESLM